jgi:hypothetical protein
METNLGVGPLPINIDEYSTFKDLSVPGELIQWISRFETSKVGAGLAYWHIDDDLDGGGNLQDRDLFRSRSRSNRDGYHQWNRSNRFLPEQAECKPG